MNSHYFQSLLFFRKDDSDGLGGTLSGKKKQVYVIMKIFKKVFDIEGEKTTSFRMKYSVEKYLEDRKYETEPVGTSLDTVIDIEGYKFENVSKELIDVGVTTIEIDFKQEGLRFKMEEQKKRTVLSFWILFCVSFILFGIIVSVLVVFVLIPATSNTRLTTTEGGVSLISRLILLSCLIYYCYLTKTN